MEAANKQLTPYETRMIREFGNALRERRIMQYELLAGSELLTAPIYEGLLEMHKSLNNLTCK